jgi:hypothetical protein
LLAPANMKSVFLRAICFAVLIPSFGSCGSSPGSKSTTSGQQRSCPAFESNDAAFESNDAGSTCSKAAAHILCRDPSGGSCECSSSDLTGCNEPTTCNPAHGYSCSDVCAETEYAVDCVQVGDQPLNLEATVGCRLEEGGPGDDVNPLAGVYCCPCQ